jgi:hypothetical protein
MEITVGANPQHRYTVLLAVLVTTVVIQSARSAFAELALDIVSTILSIAIFIAIFRGTREHAAMAIVLGLFLVIGWVRDTVPTHHVRTLALVFHGLLAIYLWCAIAAILRDLFRARRPGAQNILGAICGYLIAGAAFASVNIAAYVLAPESYNVDAGVKDLAADWHGRVALFSYYSYTQLLTIGYADVTPLRAPATTLSLVAAIFGVFYTAVVVSQLVTVAQSDRNR